MQNVQHFHFEAGLHKPHPFHCWPGPSYTTLVLLVVLLLLRLPLPL